MTSQHRSYQDMYTLPFSEDKQEEQTLDQLVEQALRLDINWHKQNFKNLARGVNDEVQNLQRNIDDIRDHVQSQQDAFYNNKRKVEGLKKQFGDQELQDFPQDQQDSYLQEQNSPDQTLQNQNEDVLDDQGGQTLRSAQRNTLSKTMTQNFSNTITQPHGTSQLFTSTSNKVEQDQL